MQTETREEIPRPRTVSEETPPSETPAETPPGPEPDRRLNGRPIWWPSR